MSGPLLRLIEIQEKKIHELEAERDALRADAARYQWLAERFTGYDFNWMPSSEDVTDGKSCAVFNVGEDFRGGRDITAAIDAAIAAKEPK